MCKIEVKPSKRIFLITLSGVLSKEEGEEFTNDLLAKLKTINTSQYYLIINTKELRAGGQDSVDTIKSTKRILRTAVFKGYYSIPPRSIIAGLQVRRVVGNDIFNKVVPVNSYEEAVGLLG